MIRHTNGRKIYYFQSWTQMFNPDLGYLVARNTLFIRINDSEKEKIKTWHHGFVIAMETITFFFLYDQPSILRFCINMPQHHVMNMTKPPNTLGFYVYAESINQSTIPIFIYSVRDVLYIPRLLRSNSTKFPWLTAKDIFVRHSVLCHLLWQDSLLS